jgi:hypothetical protein
MTILGHALALLSVSKVLARQTHLPPLSITQNLVRPKIKLKIVACF